MRYLMLSFLLTACSQAIPPKCGASHELSILADWHVGECFREQYRIERKIIQKGDYSVETIRFPDNAIGIFTASELRDIGAEKIDCFDLFKVEK